MVTVWGERFENTRARKLLATFFFSLRLCLGVYKRIEWNDYKEIEMNLMYLSKGNEWKIME